MLKQWIKVDKLDFFIAFEKILFVMVAYEYLERQEGKIRKCLFFMLKYSKITVCDGH